MTVKKGRAWLLTLWASGLVLAVATLLDLKWRVQIPTVDLRQSWELVQMSYAPYFGAALAFYFSTHKQPQARSRAHTAPFIIAIVMSTLWNLLIVTSLLRVSLGVMPIEDANVDIRELAPSLSWIVAPAIGFFFGRSS